MSSFSQAKRWLGISTLAISLSWSVIGYAADTELVVSAAASLTNAFKELGKKFESEKGVKVVFNFASSSTLLQQIEKGAPADVFASADEATVKKGVESKAFIAESVKNFVSNSLVMVVPIDSQLGLTNTQQLTGEAVKKIGIGSDNVPAGRYATESLTADKLFETLKPKFIYADSVRQVLDYVQKSEVDAGFVYATDALVAKDKVKVVATLGNHTPILYPIAIVTDSKQQELAEAFINLALSEEGMKILETFGFGKP
ncbi:molybdate ABC transporter substrate-binding protein [Beggiatoa leptomitoformis]|uniref:Molybdate ABC transporter substrate-binding protein n=1 Tax=Beggiatoa leptomitoformis TaxID=288004 RepID=A0A2N9YEH6_9GAMM|nr:molybdate ABC transporter substrate-binding protein [Beggiatoa leptomitoformis]ALG69517.2 molybdate ABC transporter substrate-binding protein [Beggiatoa leptomitoformis]AUI68897.1 molybdate ABC transporter substrate-binding protein [Beggiatoa leptomitoformis]